MIFIMNDVAIYEIFAKNQINRKIFFKKKRKFFFETIFYYDYLIVSWTQ